MDVLLRLGITLLVIAGLVGIYVFTTKWQLVRVGRKAARERTTSGLEDLRKGVPAILYFTTPDCPPCHTIQDPAIETLEKQYGENLQVIRVNAAERSDLADYWGVLSVPTTFVLDCEGQPRRVNHGVAPAHKLRQQLRELCGLGPGAAETQPDTARHDASRQFEEE